MMKKLFEIKIINVLVLLLLITNIVWGKEYKIFPSIGHIKDLRGKIQFDTIKGEVYIDSRSKNYSKLLVTNRYLIQKATDLSIKSNTLTSNELKKVEKQFNKINSAINKVDIVQKIMDNIGSAVVLDAKGMSYAVWDNTLKPLLSGLAKKGEIDILWLDVMEQIVKSSIDIFYENAKIETNLLISNGVVNKLFVGITKGLNTASLIYQGVINTAKLVNVMNALSDVSKITKEQTKNTLITSFIYDYVYKYHSDIDKMHDALVSEKMTVDTNNFWSIWALYQSEKNPNAIKRYYNEFKQYYNVAIDTNNILKQYDINYFNIYFYENIRNTIDDIYLPTIEVDVTKKFNKKYFIPHEISKEFIKSYFFIYDYSNMNNVTVLIDYTPNISVFSRSKTIDNTDRKVNVRHLINPSLVITSFVKKDSKVSSLEQQEIKFPSFYISGFFDDIKHSYWAYPEITKLFNKHIISGYNDGEFKPKNKVTVGEFLKMITNAIYLDVDKTKIQSTKKTNNLDFSNYANFLINIKKIDIGFTKDNYEAKLSKKAIRGEIAKIIAGILVKKDSTIKKEKLSCTKTDGDWDTCSDLLNSKCITHGNNGNYLPDTNITRDEVSVMIARTMNIAAGDKLTCQDRFGKDVK